MKTPKDIVFFIPFASIWRSAEHEYLAHLLLAMLVDEGDRDACDPQWRIVTREQLRDYIEGSIKQVYNRRQFQKEFLSRLELISIAVPKLAHNMSEYLEEVSPYLASAEFAATVSAAWRNRLEVAP